MVEKSGVEKSGIEKSGVEMFTQNLGLKLGVEKSGVEMSFNPQLTTKLLIEGYLSNSD